MSTDDVTERLDRLESLVEQQQEQIEAQQATIEQQRQRIADLTERGDTRDGAVTDEEQESDDRAPVLKRRTALKFGGLLTMLGMGVGTASADPSGQLGTSSDPLQSLYTDELYGNSGIITVRDGIDLDGNDLTSTSAGTDLLMDVDSTVGGAEDFAVEIEDASGTKPTVRWRRESNNDNAFRVVTDNGSSISTRLRLDDDGTLGVYGAITKTTTGDLTLSAADNVALGSTLDTSGNALEDEGTTIWDSGNGYVPQSQLQNDSVTVAGSSVSLGNSTGVDYVDLGDTGGSFPIPNGDLENSSVTVSSGNGLSGGGSASLGASTTLDINPADFAGRNLTTSGSDLDYDPPENVVVVAKSGGDYTSVSSALGSISDNKASNPYLIKVEPGVYDEKIQLKSHVDIVGAGLNATRIETTQSLVSNATLQLNGASNVEVRNMTIQGNSAAVTGETSGSDVTLQRLRLRQTEADSRRVVDHSDGTLTLRDCIVRTTRTGSEGIEAYGGTVEVVGCRIEAPDNAVLLVDTSGPTVKIRRSFVEGSNAINNVDDGSTAEAAYSHLKGGVSGSLDNKFQVHDGYSTI